ncbi:MAG TPA: thiamine pyrophosphate-binding protein [Candidatus Dormibacteraeota bacterium]|nr:thiamine pyrophosphate-binding protein [Candidatus Dormibacteraeota bacterium]
MPEKVDRRNFVKQSIVGAAALATTSATSGRENVEPRQASLPTNMAKELEVGMPSDAEVLTTDRPGSDFMVDVLKTLGFEYICANPGSTFRGLHESLTNYGGNSRPELITCCHEEISVGMAHGYAKVEGKPLAVMLHSTVGVQHASMGIYNAFCDRAPVYMISGNAIDATKRRPGVEWDHSVQDQAEMVRDFLKWDDLPISLPHFAESGIRAYKIAMTPPMGPVMLVADTDLQERPVPKSETLAIPRLTLATPPQGDSGSVAEAARLLVAAENPVIVVDHAARTPAGLALIIELAETLQAPVIDEAGRMNFPSRHPLNHSDSRRKIVGNADVILGLEVTDFYGTVNSYRDQLTRSSRSLTQKNVKLISITANDLYIKSNYQTFQRYTEFDLAMAADAEATLPSLIEAIKRQMSADRKSALQQRGEALAGARRAALDRAHADAAYGWDATPISTARLCAEIWGQIKDKDWSLVSDVVTWVSSWPLRLWDFNKHYQLIGRAGGFGVGYGGPSATGAALANRKHGRISVNIQCDGDLMYVPSVLWTAAHHRIPLLTIMHNNRAYHQEVMHIQRMANRHNRGIDGAAIGTTLTDPFIDFAKIASGMGVKSEGPITDPRDLGPAIGRALAVVEQGEPALVDVVTQPR